MEFDPKKYLENKGFDPETYLKEKEHASQEESSSIKQDIRDVMTSAGQGAFLGFGDELLAAAQAAGEVAMGEPELSDLGRLYRQYQKQREAEYEEVQKRSPILSTAGEIAGGLIPAIASGGTSVAPSLRAIIPAALKGPVATGVGMGALASLGGSKGTTEEAISAIQQGQVPEMAKDVAFGGALGGAIPIAGKGLSSVKKFGQELIEDSPTARQMIASFTEGLKGKGFIGSKAVKRVDKEAQEAAINIQNTVEKGRDFIDGIYNEVLKNNDIVFTDKEKKAFSSVENYLKRASGGISESVESEDISSLQKTINTLSKIREATTVNAQDVKNAQKYIRSLRNKPGLSFEEQTLFENSSHNLNNILKNKVEGYTDINNKFKNFENAIETFQTGIPTESRSILKKQGQKIEGTPLYQLAKASVEKSQLPFGIGSKEFEKLNLYGDELKKLEKTMPDVLKSMGIENADKYLNSIKSAADIQSLAKVIEKAGQLEQKGLVGAIGGFTIGSGYFSANIAGRPLGAIGRAVEKTKLPDLGRRLYAAADDELYDVAKKLNASGYSHMGTALENALKDKSTTAKNAVLFSIMQNPKTRKQVFGEENE